MTANALAQASKRFAWGYFISALLSLIGLADALYLTIQHLTARVCAAQSFRLFRSS